MRCAVSNQVAAGKLVPQIAVACTIVQGVLRATWFGLDSSKHILDVCWMFAL